MAGDRKRVLRTEITAEWHRDDWPVMSERGLYPAPTDEPPTLAQLEERGLLGTGWEHFRVKGREDDLATAERLRSVGIEVVSISNEHPKLKPDGYVAGTDLTVEFKTPKAATSTQARRNLRDARYQSRRLVIDIGKLGLTGDEAFVLYGRQIGRYAVGFDEVLILGNGFGILWP